MIGPDLFSMIVSSARSCRVLFVGDPAQLPPVEQNGVRKALLDALTHAGVWHDDSQVRKDSAEFGDVEPGGAVLVTVEVQRVGNSRRANSGEQRRVA